MDSTFVRPRALPNDLAQAIYWEKKTPTMGSAKMHLGSYDLVQASARASAPAGTSTPIDG